MAAIKPISFTPKSKHSAYRDPNSPWLGSSNYTLVETIHPAAILPKTSKEVSTQKPPCTPLKTHPIFKPQTLQNTNSTIMNKNKKTRKKAPKNHHAHRWKHTQFSNLKLSKTQIPQSWTKQKKQKSKKKSKHTNPL